MDSSVDDASRRWRGRQRAAAPRAFNVEKGNLFPIVRPTGSRSVSVKVRKLFGIGTIGLRAALAKLRRAGEPDRVCTSSDRSFNELPSTDGSGPDSLGDVR